MAKPAVWRRVCPEVVKNRMSQALQATLYILHQTGPTGFLLKEDGTPKKLKVCLGDTHECSCPAYIKERELCLHILWVLLKKFRVSQDNEVAFQLGLVERDIDSIIHGHLMTQTSGLPERSKEPEPGAQTQRVVSEGDVCPICQEALLGTSPSSSSPSLAYCKFGCGNSVHLKCIRVYANHLNITADAIVPCPLCRNNFGSLKELSNQRRIAGKVGVDTKGVRSVHLGVACTSCGACPVVGRCYRCVTCEGCYLCKVCCQGVTSHYDHRMEFRQHPGQPWRPTRRAQPQVPTSIPPDLISSLQSRSITEEDYDLLLQLDRPPGGQMHLVPERELCALPVKPLDSDSALILNRAQCMVCNGVYTRGEWIKTLPCKHEFHRDCIDAWIRFGHPACPIDGKPVVGKRRKKNKEICKEQCWPSGLDPALTGRSSEDKMRFTVSGRGLEGATCRQERPMCVRMASGNHAGATPSMPLASLCLSVVGKDIATLSAIGTSLEQGTVEKDRLPRLDATKGQLTSHSTTLTFPKPSDTISHRGYTHRELLESRRRLRQQRQRSCYEHQQPPVEVCTPAMSSMRYEEGLPLCCGNSICQNAGPPPAICQNAGPPPAICQNPGPPPTPHTLLHGSMLRKLSKARERNRTNDISHPLNLDTSVNTTAYKTPPCTHPHLTPTHS